MSKLHHPTTIELDHHRDRRRRHQDRLPLLRRRRRRRNELTLLVSLYAVSTIVISINSRTAFAQNMNVIDAAEAEAESNNIASTLTATANAKEEEQDDELPAWMQALLRPSTTLSTSMPSPLPSSSSTSSPTITNSPSMSLSALPTNSFVPTSEPTSSPSLLPSTLPSNNPSFIPSSSSLPSLSPTLSPSNMPSQYPSFTTHPTNLPSHEPSLLPTDEPSNLPSQTPTKSSTPSMSPTLSYQPTSLPSLNPSSLPSNTQYPSMSPTTTLSPSNVPSKIPTYSPVIAPSSSPSLVEQMSYSRQYIQRLTVSVPQSFTLDQMAIFQFLYSQYTSEFGYKVGVSAIVTDCLVLSQQIGINSVARKRNVDVGEDGTGNSDDGDDEKESSTVESSSESSHSTSSESSHGGGGKSRTMLFHRARQMTDGITNNNASSTLFWDGFMRRTRRRRNLQSTSSSTGGLDSNSGSSQAVSSSSTSSNNNPPVSSSTSTTTTTTVYPLTMRFTMTYGTRVGRYDISNYNSLFTEYVNTHLPKVLGDLKLLGLPVVSAGDLLLLKDKSLPTLKPTTLMPVRDPTSKPVVTDSPTVGPTIRVDEPTLVPSSSVMPSVELTMTLPLPPTIENGGGSDNSFVLGLSLGLVGAFMMSALGLLYYRHVEQKRRLEGGAGYFPNNVRYYQQQHHHGYSPDIYYGEGGGGGHLAVMYGGHGGIGMDDVADDIGAASKSTIDLTPNDDDEDGMAHVLHHAMVVDPSNSNNISGNGGGGGGGEFLPLHDLKRPSPHRISPQDNNNYNNANTSIDLSLLDDPSPGGSSFGQRLGGVLRQQHQHQRRHSFQQEQQHSHQQQQLDIENGQRIYNSLGGRRSPIPPPIDTSFDPNQSQQQQPVLQQFNDAIMDLIFAPSANTNQTATTQQSQISPEATASDGSEGYNNMFTLPYQDEYALTPPRPEHHQLQQLQQQQQIQQQQLNVPAYQQHHPKQLMIPIHDASFCSSDSDALIDELHLHNNQSYENNRLYDPSHLDGSQDELDNYKNQDLEILRSEIEHVVDGVEGMMSLAMARALTEPEESSMDSLPWAHLATTTTNMSGGNSNVNIGSVVEASCLCETYDWLKRFNPEKQGGLDAINEYFQDILNRIVITVMFGMTSPLQGATIVHACATILGLDLSKQLPQTTLVITGMRKTNDLTQGHNFIVKAFKLFGKIDEAAIAPNNRGFGFVRFIKQSSVERALKKYREFEIEIQDVSVSIKTLKSERPR